MRWSAVPVVWLLAVGTYAPATADVFTPPACNTPPFSDVALDAFCPWVQQLGVDQISAGCGGGNYCPTNPVTRQELAVLMERAMRGTATWDPAQGVYKRTVIVHPVPGSPADAGNALIAALAAIGDNAGDNPWLVKIEPGIYDLGADSLTMKPFVDVEGSGKGTTRITAAGRASEDDGTVILDPNSELRDLTVESTGGAAFAVAVYAPNGGRVTRTAISAHFATTETKGMRIQDGVVLRDVEIDSSPNNSSANAVGIEGAGTANDIRQTEIRAHTTGLASQSHAVTITGSVTLVEVTATVDSPAAAGFAVDATGTAIVKQSRLEGTVRGFPARLFNVTFSGAVAGDVRCVDSVNTDYRSLTRSCAPAQCDDGVDNDGTGGIDMADPECVAPSDESESL
jgi:hypothetical protein